MSLSHVRDSNGIGTARRCGSSIIDASAAIVALSVLALCLLPAAAGVRKSSKASRCLSNLARIGYANTVYASLDREDMALPVHWKQNQQCPGQEFCMEPIYVGAYEWGGKSGVGQDDFVTGTGGDSLNSRYGTKAGFGPASRPLNRILFKDAFQDYLNPTFYIDGARRDTQLDLDSVQCPSDVGYTGLHCERFKEEGHTSYDHYGTSYNANIFMTATGGGGTMYSNSPYLHRMSDLRNPARTIAYQENNGRFAWAAAPDQCSYIDGVPGYVKSWHGKDWTFNAAFIDGHADTIYMRGYHTELAFPDDPDEQPSYWCLIIRGDGWQIDTLPVPRVQTQVYHNGDGRPSYEGCLIGE